MLVRELRDRGGHGARGAGGLDNVEPGPMQHDLHWCCFPSCYQAELAHPNLAGRILIAETWHAFLKREFSGAGEVCQGTPSTSGQTATLATSGSPSLAANDLVLNVSGAKPNQPGLFFYGDLATLVPFG